MSFLEISTKLTSAVSSFISTFPPLPAWDSYPIFSSSSSSRTPRYPLLWAPLWHHLYDYFLSDPHLDNPPQWVCIACSGGSGCMCVLLWNSDSSLVLFVHLPNKENIPICVSHDWLLSRQILLSKIWLFGFTRCVKRIGLGAQIRREICIYIMCE